MFSFGKKAVPEYLLLAQALPSKPEQTKERAELMDSFDANKNGYLSLSEIDEGLLFD